MLRPLAMLAVVTVVAAACTLDNEPEAVPPSTAPPATEATSTVATVPPTIPAGDRAGVVRALDGDSLVVTVDGVEEEVRLLGINAPEGDECFGDRAGEALTARLVGQDVVLVADGEDDRDQFGRLLRHVYVDVVNVNAAMLRNGFAVAMSGSHSLADDYRAAEEAAFADRLGMWATLPCGGEGQPQQAIVITELASDPSGPDEDALEAEWVAIRNDGELPADLSGWSLRDESSVNRYVFPAGFGLAPGREVRVRTGCGTDDAANLYWCADGPIWNNGGDTALLLHSSSTVLSRLTY